MQDSLREVVVVDYDLAEVHEIANHKEAIEQAVKIPDEAQLLQIAQTYDEFYRRAEEEQPGGVEYSVPPEEDDTVAQKVGADYLVSDQEISQVNQAAEPTEEPMMEMAIASEPAGEIKQAIDADSVMGQVPEIEPELHGLAELPEPVEFLEAEPGLIELEPNLEAEVEEFWQEMEASSKSEDGLVEEANQDLVSLLKTYEAELELTPAEVQNLDERLGFDTIAVEAMQPEIAERDVLDGEIKLSAKQPDFIELVHKNIETMPEEQAEKAESAMIELEVIQELTREIISLETSGDIDPERLEQLKQELFEHAEQLLGLMGKDTDEKLVKRFVQRLMISELQKFIDIKLEPIDEGTREKKQRYDFSKFIDDLAKLDDKSRKLAQIIGSQALSQLTF